ncbi:Uncharacterised protein [Mycobacteroides abscessus subsp. massiliense]|nr:Uncharacterised protein [Mycobacteroides abscessus subsp. massiliense]
MSVNQGKQLLVLKFEDFGKFGQLLITQVLEFFFHKPAED